MRILAVRTVSTGDATKHCAPAGTRVRKTCQLCRTRTRRRISALTIRSMVCHFFSSEWERPLRFMRSSCSTYFALPSSLLQPSRPVSVKVGVPSNSARDSRWICQQLEETAPASSSHAFWAAECATQTWRAFLKKDRVRASRKPGQTSRDKITALPCRKRLP